MKTTKSKLLLLTAALFVAGMIVPDIQALAQSRNMGAGGVRNTVRRNTGNQGQNRARDNDGPLANIAENWFLEFTPGFIKASADIDKYYGATIAIGYKLSLEDKIQLEIGYYTSREFTNHTSFAYNRPFTYDRDVSGLPTPPPSDQVLDQDAMMIFRSADPETGRPKGDVSRQAKARMIPMMLSYSYALRLDSRERLELRLTPAAGFVAMFDTWKLNSKSTSPFSDALYKIAAVYPFGGAAGEYAITTTIDANGNKIITAAHPSGRASGVFTIDSDGYTVLAAESFSGGSSNKFLFAIGAGFGLTWHFADRWYSDIGYRYLWMNQVRNGHDTTNGTPWNGIDAWNGMNTHTYTFTLGWRF